MLVQEVVLRAALEIYMVDANERERVARMSWRELLCEHRRLMVTGYRHCASGNLIAEERVGSTPFRVLVEETMHALVCRRRRNAKADGEYLDARVDKIYAHEKANGQ